MNSVKSFEDYLSDVESLSIEEFHDLSHNERKEIEYGYQAYKKEQEQDKVLEEAVS